MWVVAVAGYSVNFLLVMGFALLFFGGGLRWVVFRGMGVRVRLVPSYME